MKISPKSIHFMFIDRTYALFKANQCRIPIGSIFSSPQAPVRKPDRKVGFAVLPATAPLLPYSSYLGPAVLPLALCAKDVNQSGR